MVADGKGLIWISYSIFFPLWYTFIVLRATTDEPERRIVLLTDLFG
jgi:hypothetical protein